MDAEYACKVPLQHGKIDNRENNNNNRLGSWNRTESLRAMMVGCDSRECVCLACEGPGSVNGVWVSSHPLARKFKSVA